MGRGNFVKGNFQSLNRAFLIVLKGPCAQESGGTDSSLPEQPAPPRPLSAGRPGFGTRPSGLGQIRVQARLSDLPGVCFTRVR